MRNKLNRDLHKTDHLYEPVLRKTSVRRKGAWFKKWFTSCLRLNVHSLLVQALLHVVLAALFFVGGLHSN